MKVAVVGCGQIADAHIEQIRRVAGASVEAVCDQSPHMVEQAATRFRIPRQYTDFQLLMDEVQPDVVHITTPPGSHLLLGKAVVQHGAHAYVEKPLTVTAAEAEELTSSAEQAGRLVCVGHNNAFDEAFLRLWRAYESGAFGEAVHVEAHMGYNLAGPFGKLMMSDPAHWIHRLPGGLAQNNISHPLSLILPFLTDERPRVFSQGLRWRAERFGDERDRFFDELRVSLIGRGTTATLLFSSRARPVQLGVVLHGTKGQGIASLDGRSFRRVEGASMPGPFARVQWTYREARQSRRELWRHVGGLLAARLHYFQGMHELITRFYRAIEGREKMPVPMAEAVRTARVMDDIFAVTEGPEGPA